LARHFDPRAMPSDSRQMTLLGPPPVAIHNDRHVPREAFQINLFKKRRFRAASGLQKFSSCRQILLEGNAEENVAQQHTSKQPRAMRLHIVYETHPSPAALGLKIAS